MFFSLIEMANALSYWKRHLEKKAPDTSKGYRNHLNGFLEKTGLTTEDLYEMQKRAEKQLDITRVQEVECFPEFSLLADAWQGI